MYISIQGANASMNKLGSLDLPFVPVPETLTYLNSLAVDPTLPRKKAIDTFIRRLKVNNLIEKVGKFYLPILGRVDGSKNMFDPPNFNIALPTTGATYGPNGVLFDNATVFPLPFQLNRENISLYAYNTTAGNKLTAGRLSISGSSTWLLGRGVWNSNQQAGFLVSSTARTEFIGKGQRTGLMVGCYSLNQEIISGMFDGEYKAKGNEILTAFDYQFFLGNNHNTGTMSAGEYHGIFGFGQYMTETELVKFNSFCDALILDLSNTV